MFGIFHMFSWLSVETLLASVALIDESGFVGGVVGGYAMSVPAESGDGTSIDLG